MAAAWKEPTTPPCLWRSVVSFLPHHPTTAITITITIIPYI